MDSVDQMPQNTASDGATLLALNKVISMKDNILDLKSEGRSPFGINGLNITY